ncbi:MAG: glycosyltransferase family 9 protein [Verrucomicrobia bacterium]|nr:glycosyltransferase family 9 protein [Verrucomicrobiota bacterium]
MKKNPRFLVLRGGAIGDFIVTLPVLQALRERWPDCHIELVGYPHVAGLALAAGLVSEVKSLDATGMARFFASKPVFTAEQADYIRSFDLVFTYLHDPDGLVKENLETAGAHQVIYGCPIVGELHACDHMVEPLRKLALYVENPTPGLDLDSSARDRGRRILRSKGLTGRVAVLHPGSGSPKKNWRIDRFNDLAGRLAEQGYSIAFMTGEADIDVAGQIRADMARIEGLPLSEVASVLAVCDLYIGNDSGVSHLAAALGAPAVVLFGPSDHMKWGPRGRNVRIIAGKDGDLSAISVADVLLATAGIDPATSG